MASTDTRNHRPAGGAVIAACLAALLLAAGLIAAAVSGAALRAEFGRFSRNFAQRIVPAPPAPGPLRHVRPPAQPRTEAGR